MHPLLAALALAACITACTKSESPAGPKGGATDGALAAIDAFIAEQEQAGRIDRAGNKWWRINLPPPPQVAFPAGTEVGWNLRTSHGDIGIELFPDAAPLHVASFAYLTRLGYFDGLTFHRVAPGFVIQGGCPRGNGAGSPGYRLDGEFGAGLSHDAAGWVSMANSGPGTDGSQFFITLGPAQGLDPKHTIIGKVVDGWATVEAIAALATPTEIPAEKVTIHEAKITTE
jgi:cyclophilin family peptidyl-prolyl cis-trans isomerase